ncbi:MAG: hypothetical protein AAFY34_14920 [Pseudomonadota bacterium]
MYDARKYKGGGSLKDGMAFGLFVMLAALVSFLVAFKVPDLFASASADPAARVIDANASGELTFPDIDASRLDAALRRYDVDLHAAATARLASATDTTLDGMGDLLVDELAVALAADQELFARMPIRYLNEVINLSRDRLYKAERRKNPWCKGSSYGDFMGVTDPSQLSLIGDRMRQDMADANAALAQYVVDAGAILLEGAVAARRSPTQLGPVTDQDNAALQGMVVSLVTDEQVMPLMLAAQQGDADGALEQLNICSLGVTAITAVRTLPEETKGRVWGQIMRGEFNPATLQ